MTTWAARGRATPPVSTLRHRLDNPPQRLESDTFELQADGSLRLRIVAQRPSGLVALGVLTLVGFVLLSAGVWFENGELCCTAIPTILFGLLFSVVSVLNGRWFDVDELELSPERVKISRGRQHGAQAEPVFELHSEAALSEVTSCYLYLSDKPGASVGGAGDLSVLNRAHDCPGIYFVAASGQDQRLNLAAMFKRKRMPGGIPYDAQQQARWLYTVVQQYLQTVSTGPAARGEVAPGEPGEVVLGGAEDAAFTAAHDVGDVEYPADAWVMAARDAEDADG